MSTKNLQGECQQCGGLFEFPAEAIGVLGECPHCGQPTECLLAAPPEEKSPVRTKTIIFTGVAVVILLGGLIGAQLALKRAEMRVGRKPANPAGNAAPSAKPAANPFATQHFRASAVTLETTPGTKLVHALGTLTNLTNRQRFSVKVELELLNAAGQTVGTASDYVGVIEPNAEWKFRAPVMTSEATTGRLVAIKELK